jgi:23S rRNA pseudouridine2605 synthase
MTDQELQEKRRHKWRLDGRPVRTLDEAREFLESVGFALMYPVRPPVLAPTFLGAWVGGDDRLPTWQHAFEDARAREATELMVRLLRQRAAFEANLFGETGFLVAASIFPYFYALVGERNVRPDGTATERGEKGSPLARDAFAVIQRAGPLSKTRMKELVGGEPSTAALDRALHELWSKLRITRVDYNPREGASWDVLARWAPEAVKEAAQLSVGEALSALVSQYLDCVVAAEPQEVEEFFSPIMPRSKVKESVNVLLATRELSFVHVGHRSLVEVTPARPVDPRRDSAPRRRKASPA